MESILGNSCHQAVRREIVQGDLPPTTSPLTPAGHISLKDIDRDKDKEKDKDKPSNNTNTMTKNKDKAIVTC